MEAEVQTSGTPMPSLLRSVGLIVAALTANLLVGSSAAASGPDCDGSTNVLDVVSQAGRAQGAFKAQDLARFDSSVASMRLKARCLDEELTADASVQVHLVEALSSFVQRDVGMLDSHLASVLRIDPTFKLPEWMAPEGGLLANRYEDARDLASGGFVEEPPELPDGGYWVFDGTRRGMPLGSPFLAQRVSGEGTVVWTRLVRDTDDFRRVAGVGAPQGRVDSGPSIPDPPSTSTGPRRAMLLGGISALAAGGVCLGVGLRHRRAYLDALDARPEPLAGLDQNRELSGRLDHHVQMNRGFLRGAAALGVVGLGLGVSSTF